MHSHYKEAEAELGLHTILPSSMLYDVWHGKGGSVGGRILSNGRAIVLQKSMLCRWRGAIKRIIDSRNKPLKSNNIL